MLKPQTKTITTKPKYILLKTEKTLSFTLLINGLRHQNILHVPPLLNLQTENNL